MWFDNEPVGPPQTGYIEVCKDAGDEFISRDRSVHVHDHRQRRAHRHEDILAGQCSGPIKVAAGNVNVAEDRRTANTFVSSIWTIPTNALGPNNLTNGTATVVVPVSCDTSGEVQLHFENSTLTGTLKICKYLTASSGALAGQEFYFDVTAARTARHAVSIVANTSPNGACKNVAERCSRQSTTGRATVRSRSGAP